MLKLISLLFITLTTIIYSNENINRSVAIDKSFKYHNSFDNAELKFLKLFPDYKTEILKVKNHIKPSIIVELTSSIKKDNIKGTNKVLTIYNTLRNYNSMQNIKYYSVSGEKMKTLFEISKSTNKNWKNKTEQDLDSIPKTEEVYFFQKDLTLGISKNRGAFKYENNSILSHFYNTNDLDYFFITVVKKKNLHSFFIVEEKKYTFKFYAFSFVTPSSLPLVKERISKSFGNRLVAMYNWFYFNVTK